MDMFWTLLLYKVPSDVSFPASVNEATSAIRVFFLGRFSQSLIYYRNAGTVAVFNITLRLPQLV